MDYYLQARPEGHEVQGWALELGAYRIGRADGKDVAGRLAVSGDPMMSRHHIDIEKRPEGLLVRRNAGARNPLFFKGREQDEFVMAPGDVFLTGKTRFALSDRSASGSQVPTTEYTLLRTQLQVLQEENGTASFRTMLELLPRLRQASGGVAAFQGALQVLEGLLPQASELKAVRIEGERVTPVLEVCKNEAPATPPSRRLVLAALKARTTVAHVWALQEESAIQATAHARADWAVASPVLVSDEENFCLYAVGKSPMALSDTEARRQKRSLDEIAAMLDIVAETLMHHLATERRNRFEGQVGQFFSPGLRKHLSGNAFSEVLSPQMREVTVMFFDLRGFSKATESAETNAPAEQEALDKILLHHSVLTDVMTRVTEAVFAEGGLVIDYQGDAVLACWGALSEASEAANAVRAAISVVECIAHLELPFGGQKLACGIGMATGKVVAGQIGAREQIKFGVLGKAVNLASRLEGLTKPFGVPILINDDLRRQLSPEVPTRPVGRVRPAGLNEAVEIHEVVLPLALGGSELQPAEQQRFALALALFTEGQLGHARAAFDALPDDPVARLYSARLAELAKAPLPADFDATLEFHSK